MLCGFFIARFYFEGLVPSGIILVAPSTIFLSDYKKEGDFLSGVPLPSCAFGDIYGDLMSFAFFGEISR